MVMEVTLKAAEGSAGPANLDGGCFMLSLKAFMDDNTAIFSNQAATRRIVYPPRRLNAMVQNEFQTKEVSQPLSKRRQNRCGDDVYNSQQANTNSSEPWQMARFIYERNQKRTRNSRTCSEGLLAINRCGLQGKFKV